MASSKAVTCFPSTTGPAYIPYYDGPLSRHRERARLPLALARGLRRGGSRWTRPGVASYSGIEGASFDADLPDRPTWFDYFCYLAKHPQPADQGLRPGDDITRRIKPLVYAIGHYLHRWHLADRVAARRALVGGAGRPGLHRLRLQRRRRPLPRAPLRARQRSSSPTGPSTTRSRRPRASFSAPRPRRRDAVGHRQRPRPVGHAHAHRHRPQAGRPRLSLPLLPAALAPRRPLRRNGLRQRHDPGLLSWRTRSDGHGHRWGSRMPWEEIDARQLPDALLAIDGIDFVAGRRSDGTVVMRTPAGEGTHPLARRPLRLRLPGRDPLETAAASRDWTRTQVLRRPSSRARPDAACSWSSCSGRSARATCSSAPGRATTCARAGRSRSTSRRTGR